MNAWLLAGLATLLISAVVVFPLANWWARRKKPAPRKKAPVKAHSISVEATPTKPALDRESQEEMIQSAQEIAREDPKRTAGLIRQWLSDDEQQVKK